MEEIVDHVRSRVLKLASVNPDNVVTDDLTSNIEKKDGLIRMFCKQYSDAHSGKYDAEAISERIMETMRWRKAFNLMDIKPGDFPLELWTKNPFLVFEDDETLIILYIMYNDQKICKRFTELQVRMVMYVSERYSMPAVHAGKKVMHVAVVSGFTLTNVNIPMHLEVMKLMEQHFPCLADQGLVYGVHWLIANFANFFLKYLMPPKMRKMYTVCTDEILRQYLPLHQIPVQCGGSAEYTDVVKDFELKRVKDFHADFGLNEDEAKRITKMYNKLGKRLR